MHLGEYYNAYKSMVMFYLVTKDVFGGCLWFMELHTACRREATGIDLVVDVLYFVELMYIMVLRYDFELHCIMREIVTILCPN